MENIYIPFYVKNTAVINKRPSLCPVSQSRNIYSAEFVFSPMWDGVTTHVQFSRDGQETVDVTIIDGLAQIPNSMLLSSGTITVCVYGGDLATTTSAKITVLPSDYQSSASEPPTPEAGVTYIQTPTGTDGVQSLKIVDGELCYLVGESYRPLAEECGISELTESCVDATEAANTASLDASLAATAANAAAQAASTATEAANTAAQAASQNAQAAMVVSASINELGHLIVTQSNGDTIDCGYAKGEDGSSDVENCATAHIALAVGNGSVSVTDAEASNLRELCIYGKMRIDGTANPDANTKRSVESITGVKINGSSAIAVRNLYAVGDSCDSIDLVSGVKNILCAEAELTGTEQDGTYVYHASIADDDGTVYVYRLDNADFGLISANSLASEVSVISDSFETGEGIYSVYSAQYGRVYGHHQLHSIFFCTHIAPGTGTAAQKALPFTAWLAERYNSGILNGIKIWYKLSVPSSETLSQNQIAFVEGQNTISLTLSACNEIKASYKQNLGIALDELRSAISAISAGI